MAEEIIGKVSDFFAHPVVAGIELTGSVKVGDKIKIKGHTTDLELTVDSMQIDNKNVTEAKKVKEHIRKNSDWLELMYLPAYSPQFNPIEQLWKYGKYIVTHNTFYVRIEELENSLREFFAEIKLKKNLIKSICSVGYLVD